MTRRDVRDRVTNDFHSRVGERLSRFAGFTRNPGARDQGLWAAQGIDMEATSATPEPTNSSQPLQRAVHCYVRVRQPLPDLQPEDSVVWTITGDSIEAKGAPSATGGAAGRRFPFDGAFDHRTSNQALFTEVLIGRVHEMVLHHTSSTLLLYGPSKSGKRAALLGTSSEDQGLLELAVQELFSILPPQESEGSSSVTISGAELYDDKTWDLLQDREAVGAAKDALRLDELTKHPIESAADLGAVISRLLAMQAELAFGMGSRLKYRHTIVRVSVAQPTTSGRGGSSGIDTALVMVVLAGAEGKNAPGEGASEPGGPGDLAGMNPAAHPSPQGPVLQNELSKGAARERAAAERAAKSAALSVSKGLFNIATVVNRLTFTSMATESGPQKAKVFIPYRNSKLTWLLRTALAPDIHLTVVCSLPSHLADAAEWAAGLKTLRFGMRVRNMRLRTESSSGLRAELAAHVHSLQALLEALPRATQYQPIRLDGSSSSAIGRSEQQQRGSPTRKAAAADRGVAGQALHAGAAARPSEDPKQHDEGSLHRGVAAERSDGNDARVADEGDLPCSAPLAGRLDELREALGASAVDKENPSHLLRIADLLSDEAVLQHFLANMWAFDTRRHVTAAPPAGVGASRTAEPGSLDVGSTWRSGQIGGHKAEATRGDVLAAHSDCAHEEAGRADERADAELNEGGFAAAFEAAVYAFQDVAGHLQASPSMNVEDEDDWHDAASTLWTNGPASSTGLPGHAPCAAAPGKGSSGRRSESTMQRAPLRPRHDSSFQRPPGSLHSPPTPSSMQDRQAPTTPLSSHGRPEPTPPSRHGRHVPGSAQQAANPQRQRMAGRRSGESLSTLHRPTSEWDNRGPDGGPWAGSGGEAAWAWDGRRLRDTDDPLPPLASPRTEGRGADGVRGQHLDMVLVATKPETASPQADRRTRASPAVGSSGAAGRDLSTEDQARGAAAAGVHGGAGAWGRRAVISAGRAAEGLEGRHEGVAFEDEGGPLRARASGAAAAAGSAAVGASGGAGRRGGAALRGNAGGKDGAMTADSGHSGDARQAGPRGPAEGSGRSLERGGGRGGPRKHLSLAAPSGIYGGDGGLPAALKHPKVSVSPAMSRSQRRQGAGGAASKLETPVNPFGRRGQARGAYGAPEGNQPRLGTPKMEGGGKPGLTRSPDSPLEAFARQNNPTDRHAGGATRQQAGDVAGGVERSAGSRQILASADSRQLRHDGAGLSYHGGSDGGMRRAAGRQLGDGHASGQGHMDAPHHATVYDGVESHQSEVPGTPERWQSHDNPQGGGPQGGTFIPPDFHGAASLGRRIIQGRPREPAAPPEFTPSAPGVKRALGQYAHLATALSWDSPWAGGEPRVPVHEAEGLLPELNPTRSLRLDGEKNSFQVSPPLQSPLATLDARIV
ncbi:hypothetical protein CYMTET_45233 [Cymbomonas tetramitiformis]|uniref:Kinesin motor domain-containing protein n=1 Tax=Cymbomonas tetramitiformis TaxID=36881 RepID=A0AAE0BYN1_9CHLO|nr:hypothetical protein CYMTET_45233 [Cymbomonas tetramitiformis]